MDADRCRRGDRRFSARTALTVARLPADFTGNYRVEAAVFIHFDGSDPPCRSRASIGYSPKRDAGGSSGVARVVRTVLAVRISAR